MSVFYNLGKVLSVAKCTSSGGCYFNNLVSMNSNGIAIVGIKLDFCKALRSISFSTWVNYGPSNLVHCFLLINHLLSQRMVEKEL